MQERKQSRSCGQPWESVSVPMDNHTLPFSKQTFSPFLTLLSCLFTALSNYIYAYIFIYIFYLSNMQSSVTIWRKICCIVPNRGGVNQQLFHFAVTDIINVTVSETLTYTGCEIIKCKTVYSTICPGSRGHLQSLYVVREYLKLEFNYFTLRKLRKFSHLKTLNQENICIKRLQTI